MPIDNALTILTLLARTNPISEGRHGSDYWCNLCGTSRDVSMYRRLSEDPLYNPENHKPRCPWRLATELLDSKGILWRISD